MIVNSLENRRTAQLATVVLCVVYIAARLWRLTDSCLWFDEIFGVHAAEHSWDSLFWFVAQDLIHPPLFYVFLKIWIGIGSESLLWLRLFPVFFSTLALIPFLFLCRELKLKTPTVLISLLLLAVNGSLIKYSQDVRMYSLLLFLSLVSMWLFARFFFRGKDIWILTFVNVLLVYTHYFGWLVVLGEIAAIAILQRIKIRHVLIMFAIDLITFIPWMLIVFRASQTGSEVSQNIGWIEHPGFRLLFDLATDILEPFFFPLNSTSPFSILWISVPILGIVVVAAGVYFATWKSRENRETFWLLVILVAVPVLMAFLFSWVSPYSVWGSRHLIIIFVPAVLLVAIFLTGIENATLRVSLLGVLALLILIPGIRYSTTKQPNQIWCAWETLAQQIPTDDPQTIYTFEDLTAYHLWFATRKQQNLSIVKVDGFPDMVEDPAYFLPRGFDEVRPIKPDGMAGEKFWVAFRDINFNLKHPPISNLQGSGFVPVQRFEIGTSSGKAFLVQLSR